MRNTWLVIRREYLERVRSKAFLISTILVPLFMFAAIALPVKLATMRTSGAKRIVLATSSAEFGEAYRRQLETAAKDTGSKFDLTVDTRTTPEERTALRARVEQREIDGFVWAPDEAVA